MWFKKLTKIDKSSKKIFCKKIYLHLLIFLRGQWGMIVFFSCEGAVMLTNDLYHVNQHNIPYIMQKNFFLKYRFLEENNFFPTLYLIQAA